MKNSILILFGSLLFLASCNKEKINKAEDFFYLESKGASMPVWIRGNVASNKFIIFLHGGPEGGSSQYYTIFPSHKKIEEECAIVYWDQRMCGMSQGNPSMANANLDQFTTDLDQLISIINERFNSPDLFLMGHSWGGALGTNYLLTHQSKIKGWIEVDGGHAWTQSNALSREIMMAVAAERIGAKDETEFWQFAENWYNEHPVVGINDNAHYSFVGAANGYDYNFESDSLPIPFTDLLLKSPISTAYFFVPYHFDFLDKGLDLQNRLHEITVPTLICWGEHDKVFPVAMAHDTYNKLGTANEDKYIKIFSASAHSPNYEEPTAFANEVIDFITKY